MNSSRTPSRSIDIPPLVWECAMHVSCECSGMDPEHRHSTDRNVQYGRLKYLYQSLLLHWAYFARFPGHGVDIFESFMSTLTAISDTTATDFHACQNSNEVPHHWRLGSVFRWALGCKIGEALLWTVTPQVNVSREPSMKALCRTPACLFDGSRLALQY
jgi:hypothetical protein